MCGKLHCAGLLCVSCSLPDLIGFNNVQGERTFEIQVHPRPRIALLQPAIGPTGGDILVTVIGSNLAPTACRRGAACAGIFVSLGGLPCPVEGVATPEQVTCRIPRGLGLQSLQFEVVDGAVNRSTKVTEAFVQHDMILGGLTVRNEGYMAYGFGGGDASNVKQASSYIFTDFYPLSSKGIRAVQAYKSKTYIGGGFLETKGSSANHIAVFDGNEILPLGSGVDGIVNDLALFQDLLIVGGSFTKAIRQPLKRMAWFNTGVLRTGGLATWNGNEWGTVGSRPLLGIVTSLHVNGSIIYVGGRFDDEGRKNNLARFNGSSWDSVCGLALQNACGVTGGEILAMVALGEDLYVGGSFVRAGGVPALRVARWDGREWFAMQGFDGDVHALAVLDGTVYAAGVFGSSASTSVSYLAQWRLGAWQGLQGGVNGPVFTLLALDSCLYVGGMFDSAGGENQIMGVGVRNAARWCFDRNGREDSSWGAMHWPRSDVGVCRVIKPSQKASPAP